jgi:two-component system chemotaxis sensor kinase CheA
VKRVLVVDDEPDLRTIIGQVLREAGYAVATAANGAEALEQLRRQRADGVVLDLNMPVMDGPSVLRVCRADPAYAAVPVAVCTTESAAAPLPAALRVQARIPKPFDLDELVDVVAHLVDQAADQPRAPEFAEWPGAIPAWRDLAQLDRRWAAPTPWARAAVRARRTDLARQKLAHTHRIAGAADACLTRARARLERSRQLLAAPGV